MSMPSKIPCQFCGKRCVKRGLRKHQQTCKPARQFRADDARAAIQREVEASGTRVGYATAEVDFDSGLDAFDSNFVHNARVQVSDQLMPQDSLRTQRILVQRRSRIPASRAQDDDDDDDHDDDDDDEDDDEDDDDDEYLAMEEGRYYPIDVEDSSDDGEDNVHEDNGDAHIGEEADELVSFPTNSHQAPTMDHLPMAGNVANPSEPLPLHNMNPIQHDDVTNIHPDPFHHTHFNEDAMKTYLHRPDKVNDAQDSLLAQLDLILLLQKAGCPLTLHDKIIDWLVYYTRKNKDIWTDSNILHRKPLIELLAGMYNTKGRFAQHVKVKFPYDGRSLLLPKFSFVNELMSLLHDELMSPENIVDGYDVMTGLVNGQEYWKDASINEEDLWALPEPHDPERCLGEVPSGTKFQKSVKRFAPEAHHLPIPLVLFYDKANLDRFGALATAPLIFSFAFFKNSVRARRMAWRLLALVPNMSVGKGKSSKKTADERCDEHHLVLLEAFREVIHIVNQGGFKTEFRGKPVVLKIWIQFIIGDTEGHNDLCGHFNKHTKCMAPMRDCHCGSDELSTVPLTCQPILLREIAERAKADEEAGRSGKRGSQLHTISQRPMKQNVFDLLPMANEARGIHGCTNFETMHVFDQGLYKHICLVIDAIISDKTNKDRLNEIFRNMSRYLGRQSDRDFPRRATRFAFTDGTRITATESKGNMLNLLLVLNTRDGFELVQQHFNKVPGTGTTVGAVSKAIVDLLSYEKWVLQSNTASEVLGARAEINALFARAAKAFPRELVSKTVQWNIPKFHGAARMDLQMAADGSGAAWDSSHGEEFHKELSKKNAKATQQRTETLAPQMAQRAGENVTLERAARVLHPRLMPKCELPAGMLSPTATSLETTRRDRSYMNPALVKVHKETSCRGEFKLIVPGLSMEADKLSEMGRVPYEMKWKDRDKHLAQGASTFQELVIGISHYAVKSNWMGEVHCTGFTTMRKRDPTQGVEVTYRADPMYAGREWRDWAIVDSFEEGTNIPNTGNGDVGNLCPGWIVGFVRFNQPGFPTPGRSSRAANGVTPNPFIDPDLYAIVRCASQTMEIHKKFITKFKLQDKVDSMYVLPMWAVVGPLAAVPDLHTGRFRTHQDKDQFMVVKPYRLWGDHFGNRVSSSGDHAEPAGGMAYLTAPNQELWEAAMDEDELGYEDDAQDSAEL